MEDGAPGRTNFELSAGDAGSLERLPGTEDANPVSACVVEPTGRVLPNIRGGSMRQRTIKIGTIGGVAGPLVFAAFGSAIVAPAHFAVVSAGCNRST
jgi:hypothetical protein